MLSLEENSITKCMSFTANATGGEYKHKLTIEEIPAHSHQVNLAWDNNRGSTSSVSGDFQYLLQNDKNAYGLVSTVVGEDQSHNNIQPYTAIYRWRRAA